MCRAEESVARTRCWGVGTERRLGASGWPLRRQVSRPDERNLEYLVGMYLCNGTAILLTTVPVSVSAHLRIPSVPAVIRYCPSLGLKTTARQLPLCLRVFQIVLMSPWSLSINEGLSRHFKLAKYFASVQTAKCGSRCESWELSQYVRWQSINKDVTSRKAKRKQGLCWVYGKGEKLGW